jgi:hypothetical protein
MVPHIAPAPYSGDLALRPAPYGCDREGRCPETRFGDGRFDQERLNPSDFVAQVADFDRVQEAVRRAFLPTCYTGSGRPDAAFIIGHTITNRRLVIAPADHSVVHWSILEIAAKLPELVVDNIRYQPRWQDILRLPRRKLAAFGTPNRPRNDPSVTEQLRAMGELLSREILQHFSAASFA